MAEAHKPARIKTGLIGVCVAVCALIAIGSGLYSHKIHHDLLIDDAFERLKLFHSLRKASLEDYLDSVVSEVLAVSFGERTLKALKDFKEAWADLGENPSEYLREIYIKTNPFPVNDRQKLVKGDDDSAYSRAHAAFHPFATELLDHFGFYNLFLMDEQGNILYTVAKEDDFATNIRNGPFADTHLQLVFDQAVRRKGKRVSLSDFERYPPSNNEPAAFAGGAIMNDQGKVIGVLAVQLPEQPINDLLQFSEGLGKTGETYIVGADKLFRSQSRFIASSTLLNNMVDTTAVSKGISGFSGQDIIEDYRGIRVLSVYSPIDRLGQRWVLIAEIGEQEVLNDLNPVLFIFIGTVMGLLTLGTLLLIYNVYTRFGMK